ncbi:MAG TPA: NADH:flavin oxidoreductase/NADH oxidase [Candidatus Acidoferrales bacterium]|nr:NADH:flavin oxidoreductase/NADH oxidase [Candidatus Acidoferrales bacterium]
MHLFESPTFRSLTLRNRIGVSPMCEYSCVDGAANDWHLVHLGSRAVGGAGLVLTEAAAVEARGRISPADLGIYDDRHIEPLARVTRFISAQGAVPGIQLAHAGRKASTAPPWEGGRYLGVDEGGWRPILAPSPLPFSERAVVPAEMTLADIAEVTAAFARAAERALAAGFKVVEVHGAHGYLLHEFASPLSNKRTDAYGGSLAHRTRFAREVVTAIRAVWPEQLPLFYRISATDWVDGGWDLDQSVALARELGSLGVDLIDCSSGGSVPNAAIPSDPGYQVPFAQRIRHEAQIATAAVGMITTPAQADEIVRSEKADLVFLARQFLRDPYWPLHAAYELGVDVPWPVQYERAKLPLDAYAQKA